MTIRTEGTRCAAAHPILPPARGPRRAVAVWLAAALLSVYVVPAQAVRAPDNPTDAGFIIPGAGAVQLADGGGRSRLDRMDGWQTFRARHGAWTSVWNARTGTPHRAFGPPIALTGFAEDPKAIEGAVRAFIADNAALFGTPVLETQRVQRVRDVWYVSFRQTLRGLPVLFSDWEFRVGPTGGLFAFGVDAARVNPDDISIPARLPAPVVREAARAGLSFVNGRDRLEGGESLSLLPVASERGTVYRVVAEARVQIADPPGDWMTLVDAGTGEVLVRQNRVRHAISGTVTGTIHPNLPTEVPVAQPLKNLRVNVGATPVNTNASGAYSAAPGATVTVSAQLLGPFCNVNRSDGGIEAQFSVSSGDPATVNIAFNSGNSTDSERDGFYHVNLVHDYIRTLDPGSVNLDYQAACNVNVAGNCNAFYSSDGSVNFYNAGGGCPNMATMPDVVYHEYGHGVNEHIYFLGGSPGGMFNGALHEGMADVLAAMIQDNSHMGKGFFGPGTVLRELDNTRRWPQDASGDGHISGLIIAGAFWDLRELAGLTVAAQTSHFAKYGIPDDPDDGVAMSEYFIETLIADDDDSNLGNGTPHGNEIVSAFNLHGIGTGFFMDINQTPLSDQPGTGSYPVAATVTYNGPFGALAGAPTLYYAYNNGAFSPVAMTATGNPNEYAGSIPGTSGAVVRYYVSATDTYGQATTDPPNAPSFKTNRFVAGPAITQFSQDMETNPAWTVGAVGDNAVTGIWVRTDPNGTQVTAGIDVQPESDHTVAGIQCWVTGNGAVGEPAGTNDVDGGRTTLLTHQFDAVPPGMINPVVSYWRWYSNNQGSTPGTDTWRVDISNDGGINWVSVENTMASDASWQRIVFRIADYVAPTAFMRLRFIAEDAGSGSLVEAAVDDFDLLAFNSVVGVGDDSAPRHLALSLASAHPAPGLLRLSYALPITGPASLRLFDVGGRAVRTLVSGEIEAGPHTVEWDGRDDRGARLPSGTYFARLEANGQSVSRTLVRTH